LCWILLKSYLSLVITKTKWKNKASSKSSTGSFHATIHSCSKLPWRHCLTSHLTRKSEFKWMTQVWFPNLWTFWKPQVSEHKSSSSCTISLWRIKPRQHLPTLIAFH
jgi:hypothetical protein